MCEHVTLMFYHVILIFDDIALLRNHVTLVYSYPLNACLHACIVHVRTCRQDVYVMRWGQRSIN